jgi:hypothetical protein
MKGLFLLAAGVQVAFAAPAPAAQFNGLPNGLPNGNGFPPNFPSFFPSKGTPKGRTTIPSRPTSTLPVGLTLSPAQPAPKSTSSSATPKPVPKESAPSVPKEWTPVPSGPPCRNIPGDPEWPTDDIWKSELPGVIAVAQKIDEKHPNYHYSARNHGDVQAAVNFAVRHHVRLSIIASGHVGFTKA